MAQQTASIRWPAERLRVGSLEVQSNLDPRGMFTAPEVREELGGNRTRLMDHSEPHFFSRAESRFRRVSCFGGPCLRASSPPRVPAHAPGGARTPLYPQGEAIRVVPRCQPPVAAMLWGENETGERGDGQTAASGQSSD